MNSLKLILSNLRYFGPAWVFASLNIITGTWVLYIPHIKTKLSIDDGQLGIALFCFACGTLTMIPLSSIITRKFGLGRTTLIGITLFSLSFLIPVIVPSYLSLCFSLYVVGLLSCLTDIAMNALVSEIEQADDVHFMSASHGFFSLGGVIGAGIGSVVITYFDVPITHMLYVVISVIITNILVSHSYLKIRGKKSVEEKKTINISSVKPLLGLTVIAFLIMGSEGAIEHWSKLYLQNVVSITSERLSGFGFVAFSFTMTLGRFFGDAVSKHFGSIAIIISGCFVGLLGFVAVLSSGFILAILGFGLVGLGFSVIIPELFRLAGKTPGISSAQGISFVAGFGYLGFLLSPPFLGFLSKIESLRLSFLALLVFSAVSIFASLFIRKL